ncbi:MAG: PSD1 domain-containing protein [Planctomycetales bacterium]|nr:PSD1 domain-containing protein [Planctomycetales bacterium]
MNLGVWPLVLRVCLVVALVSPCGKALAQDGSAERDDHFDFERVIRPILVAQCLECHADSRAEAGLELTSREAILRGGDSGAAWNESNPQRSLLLQAIRREDGLEMPPEHPLRESDFRALEAWVLAGVPWSTESTTSEVRKVFEITADDREHWSFRPLSEPNVPSVVDADWCLTPIDRFVAARREEAGIVPAERADRRTLLRRLAFDLTGLPPDDTDLRRALADQRPDEVVLAREVDRLLASPRYGERWGRHWLDVARFADTKDGVLMFGDDRMRPYAYTYRDYVVRAWNEDLPFDQFVVDQIAADLVEDQEPWRLSAMGFLTLGRMYDNNIHDVIDDQIDVVTRGFLGLTVTCARCHDHKYDPVSMVDYYALYGIFASSEAPLELPRIDDEPLGEEATQAEVALENKRNEITSFRDEQYALLSATARERTVDYLVRIATKPADPLETAIFFLSLAPTDLRPQITHRWRFHIDHTDRRDSVFGPWHQIKEHLDQRAGSGNIDEHRQSVAALVESLGGESNNDSVGYNRLVLTALSEQPPGDHEELARVYGQLLVDAWRTAIRDEAAEATADVPTMEQFIEQRRATREEFAELQSLMVGQESPAYFPISQTRKYMSREHTDRFGGLMIELDRMATQNRAAAARAMVVLDKREPYQPHLFVRGNPSVLGEPVERGFLTLCSTVGVPREDFSHGSGRLALARSIASPANPLTPRVFVNRVWMHHFGAPLVSSPSDFGRRSLSGPHQELLDHLASRFVSEGWSIKNLQRRIVLSQVYAQSTRPASATATLAATRDPDNQLLWSQPMRRLELEAMRDSLFAVSNSLDYRMGGRPTDATAVDGAQRRTVYGLVDRQNLPGLFRVFDFASPDVSVGRRPRTLVAQQALFALNSPLMVARANELADYVLRQESDDDRRLELLVWRVWQRAPSDEERAWMSEYLATDSETTTTASAWERLAQTLLASNEFLYVD